MYAVTKDENYTTAPAWIPGLVAYGAVTVTCTRPGGSTTAEEYSVSHDGGFTWTDWAAVGASISDTPNLTGEYIKFRVKKTDSGTSIPYYTSIVVACTFSTGWVAPTAWAINKTFLGGGTQ